MSRSQLEDYLTDIYLFGKEEGISSAKAVARLEKALDKVKGVGGQKKEWILEQYDLECRRETGEIRRSHV